MIIIRIDNQGRVRDLRAQADSLLDLQHQRGELKRIRHILRAQHHAARPELAQPIQGFRVRFRPLNPRKEVAGGPESIHVRVEGPVLNRRRLSGGGDHRLRRRLHGGRDRLRRGRLRLRLRRGCFGRRILLGHHGLLRTAFRGGTHEGRARAPADDRADDDPEDKGQDEIPGNLRSLLISFVHRKASVSLQWAAVWHQARPRFPKYTRKVHGLRPLARLYHLAQVTCISPRPRIRPRPGRRAPGKILKAPRIPVLYFGSLLRRCSSAG